MEKFELLYGVLFSLHKAGILSDCVLIGSWCQDFYRTKNDSRKYLRSFRRVGEKKLMTR